MSLVSEQKKERRERILEVARQLIAEKGYERTTMRDLAVASGVSVPTIYNLCGTKDELLFQAVAGEVAASIDRLVGPAAMRGRRRLIALLGVGHEEMSRRPQYYRALLGAATRAESARAPLLAIGERLAEELCSALDQMQSEAELEPWVNTTILARRLSRICVLATFEWASGALDADAALAVTRLDAGLALLGVTRGPARTAMERMVRREQRVLRSGRG